MAEVKQLEPKPMKDRQPSDSGGSGPPSDGGSSGGGSGGSSGRGPGPGPRPGAGTGFLSKYKPEQGKGTRLGTFIGAAALIAWGSRFLFQQLDVVNQEGPLGLVIKQGIPIAFAVVVGLVMYWVVYVKRNSSDFLIATEGEMKKVNWSSRAEVIGSTRVVIVFTVLMSLLLFVVTLGFQGFFRWIGVLEG